MSFRPFQREFADHRVVLIPPSLDDEHRARFTAKVAAAVKQQSGLAAKCDAVLKVGGEIRVDGDRILIPHEPAAPGDPAAIGSGAELPEIEVVWWLSWSLVQALKATAPGTPHGGIQIDTLYLDEAGRVKLGDFGIAPAFEAVCGREARRQIHCDGTVRPSEVGRGGSGVWSLLSEDDTREHGWIAPYFAHELLEGGPRLNPKADQFAAGAVLYLLATGTHPYGASLSDPTLMFYFHLEPFPVGDERSEWEEIFKRQEAGFTTAADKPILGWSEFVQRLLGSDPGGRFANAAEAAGAANQFAAAAWDEASRAISAGLKLLDDGEVDAFLEKTVPWRDEERLPDLWRGQLASWIADIEARKEEIAAYKRLGRRLAEGQRALSDIEIERAREIAREVHADQRCDDVLRAAAEELIAFCDEQEEFIRSGADDLAKVYLESAREYLARHEFGQARQMLKGLLGDPATPGARAAQARELIAEIELAEQRLEQQQAELSGAGDDLSGARYDAAQQRLEALLEEESLPETLAKQARALLEEVTEAQARRATYLATLEEAQAAWERADLKELDTRLAEVPGDFADPQVTERRADLSSRRDRLQAALERQAAAEKALGADDPKAGLAHAELARKGAELPKVLGGQLDELVARCQTRIDELERARVERLWGLLGKAEEDCEALHIDECRRRLEGEVLSQEHVPEEITAKAEQLLQACQRIERARALFERARQQSAEGAFRAALALVDGFKSEGLPPAVVAQSEQLRDEVTRARDDYVERQQQQLAAQLDGIEKAVATGQLEEAESSLKKVETSEYLSDDLRARTAGARSAIKQQRPVLTAIRAAEAALAAEPADSNKPLAALECLPDELPDWAPVRIEAIRKRAAELAEQRRREALRRGRAALDAAQSALETGEVPAGRRQLQQARGALELDPALAERHEQLAAHAALLEEWLPKVAAAAETVERGEFLSARRELSDLLEDQSAPELCRARLAELKNRTDRHIAARQQEIDAELVTLAADLTRRGRRARKFPQRVAALKGDSLATEQHQVRVDELLREYEQLPEPKTPKAPLVVAGCVVVVAVVWAGLYFGGVFSGDDDGEPVVTTAPAAKPEQPPEKPPEEPPVVVEDVGERLTAALSRLRGELAEAAEQAAEQGRVCPRWQLVFEPADELPTTLVATEPAEGGREVVGAAESLAELEQLGLTAELIERLFPVPPPPEPSIEERLAAVVERLQGQVDAARLEAGGEGQDAPRFIVRVDPPDSLPAVVIAQNQQTAEDVRLGSVDEAELDEFALADGWQERLYPRPPPKPSLEEVAEAYLAELRESLPEVVVGKELMRVEEGVFAVGGQWNGRELVSFADLRFDEQEAVLTPPVASVAEHFRLQVSALAALAEPLTVTFPIDDEAYQARLRLAGAAEDVVIAEVDSRARSVRVRAMARLDGDPRSASGFAFDALYRDGELVVDGAARSAFEGYVRELQVHQSEESLRGVGEALELPAGVRLSWPDDFAGGARVGLSVLGADQRTFAEFDAVWNSQRLLYEIDAEEARAALRAGVRAIARDGATRQALAGEWPRIRQALAPPADQPGVKYLERCELLEVGLRDEQPDEPFVVAVELAAGPPSAVAEERIRFPVRLVMREGVLGWDPDATREARATIVARLQALARSEEVRARRRQGTLAQLVRELQLDRDAVQVESAGDELQVVVAVGGRQRHFTWTWDVAELRYGNRVESAPPAVVSLDGRLARLASDSGAGLSAFVEALTEVSQEKIGRYGTSGYGLVGEFANAGDPADGLVAVSAGLQRLTAPTPTRDPFPVIFVEYFVGESDVYGLSWRAVTDDADTIVGVADAKVWQVMPAARLRGYGRPAEFRREYSADVELGERLLGQALGEVLSGSENRSGGSFGVIIAPDGPLWLTRWEQVCFSPRPVEKLATRGARDVKRVGTLRELLRPGGATRAEPKWRRAGVWCVPVLAGQWQGLPEHIDKLQLGVLVAGNKPSVASFRRRGSLLFAPVTDPTLTGDFGWVQFARSVRREEIGYRFWDRRWDDRGWNPTPFTSFSLIQIP